MVEQKNITAIWQVKLYIPLSAFISVLYSCYDFPNYKAIRRHSEFQSSDIMHLLFQIVAFNICMVPHFMYSDDYIPRYWPLEQG